MSSGDRKEVSIQRRQRLLLCPFTVGIRFRDVESAKLQTL